MTKNTAPSIATDCCDQFRQCQPKLASNQASCRVPLFLQHCLDLTLRSELLGQLRMTSCHRPCRIGSRSMKQPGCTIMCGDRLRHLLAEEMLSHWEHDLLQEGGSVVRSLVLSSTVAEWCPTPLSARAGLRDFSQFAAIPAYCQCLLVQFSQFAAIPGYCQ